MAKSKKRATASTSSSSPSSKRKDNRDHKRAKRATNAPKGGNDKKETEIPAGALQQQPRELLAQIANYCCGWHGTVTNLAMTCRAFRDVLDDPVLVPYRPWPRLDLSFVNQGDRVSTKPDGVIFSTDQTRVVLFQKDSIPTAGGKLMVYDKKNGFLGIIHCARSFTVWPIFSPDNSILVFMDSTVAGNNAGIKICPLPTQTIRTSAAIRNSQTTQQLSNAKTTSKRRPLRKKKQQVVEFYPYHRLTSWQVGTVGFLNSTTIVTDVSHHCRVFRVKCSKRDVQLQEVEEQTSELAPEESRIRSAGRLILAPVCVGKNRDILVRVQGLVVEFINAKTGCAESSHTINEDPATYPMTQYVTVTRNGNLVVQLRVHVLRDVEDGIPTHGIHSHLHIWNCSQAVSPRDLGTPSIITLKLFENAYPTYPGRLQAISFAPSRHFKYNIIFNFLGHDSANNESKNIVAIACMDVENRFHCLEWDATSWELIAA